MLEHRLVMDIAWSRLFALRLRPSVLSPIYANSEVSGINVEFLSPYILRITWLLHDTDEGRRSLQ